MERNWGGGNFRVAWFISVNISLARCFFCDNAYTNIFCLEWKPNAGVFFPCSLTKRDILSWYISASNIRAGVETRPPQLRNVLYFSCSIPSLTFYGSPHPSFVRFCDTRISILELCATCSWNGDDFLPVLPSLRFSPSNSCLFWWILSANSCLLVSNSIFLWGVRKAKT